MIVVKALLILFFTQDGYTEMALYALYMVGLWKLFEKSGLEGWWALVPFARDYQLARCAGRESEGPVYSLSSFGLTMLNVIMLFLNRTAEEQAVLSGRDLLITILAITLSLDDYFIATYTKPATFDTISTYVVNATKGSQTQIKTALWALSTLIFLLVIVIVIVMNISSRRTEKKGDRAA